MIYHITTVDDWSSFSNLDHYFPIAFAAEKFVHCCKASQIEGVLLRYYNETTEYILLCIDDKTILDKVIMEKVPNGDMFPHVYAHIPKASIVRVYSGPQRSILHFVKEMEKKEK